MNSVPSPDTLARAFSTRRFSQSTDALLNATVLMTSADQTFALGRIRASEGLSNVTSLLALHRHVLMRSCGMQIAMGPFAGLIARTVVMLAEDGVVGPVESVREIKNEPTTTLR